MTKAFHKMAILGGEMIVALFLSLIKMAAAAFNMFDLFKMSQDHDRCLDWCKGHNLLASSMKCPKEYNNNMSWRRRNERPDGFEWRCSKRSCNDKISIHHDSFVMKDFYRV